VNFSFTFYFIHIYIKNFAKTINCSSMKQLSYNDEVSDTNTPYINTKEIQRKSFVKFTVKQNASL